MLVKVGNDWITMGTITAIKPKDRERWPGEKGTIPPHVEIKHSGGGSIVECKTFADAVAMADQIAGQVNVLKSKEDQEK